MTDAEQSLEREVAQLPPVGDDKPGPVHVEHGGVGEYGAPPGLAAWTGVFRWESGDGWGCTLWFSLWLNTEWDETDRPYRDVDDEPLAGGWVTFDPCSHLNFASYKHVCDHSGLERVGAALTWVAGRVKALHPRAGDWD